MTWPFPEIYVLRHGETAWNAERRMQGALNSPLTVKGVAQAEAQGRIMASIDLDGFDIIVSPQGRAFQTAAIALAPFVANLRTDPELSEIKVGDWSGMLRDDLPTFPDAKDTPDGVLEMYDHAPGGEGFEGLRARCLGFLQQLKRPSVLVTHGITSRMIRTLHLGRDIDSLGDLPGGQGVVFHLRDGAHHRLQE
ncbi:histidine phosphatase family protein [Shimia ponticola]|uniref:histidine phosphatase family protein n=1 Tax=Shimia ponticola TaxID=2582893 RepID=UPI0011BF122D|nr:histidine phosphatase family protein [Shimia ponticola]